MKPLITRSVEDLAMIIKCSHRLGRELIPAHPSHHLGLPFASLLASLLNAFMQWVALKQATEH